MDPRLAQPTDLEHVLRLAHQKTYPLWPSQPRRREELLALYSRMGEDNEWQTEYDLWVSEANFLLLQKQLIRGITGDRESVILDAFALQEPWLECAARAARGYDSQFLTLELSPDQDPQPLLHLGYQLESHKISVPTADCPMPEGSPYSVRAPQPGDDFSIAVLHSTMLHHTLCAGRDYDLSDLTFRSMDAILHQVNRQDPQSLTLVLTHEQRAVGHLLLELSEQDGYIYDLAVAREHWGGKAVLHIMRAGSQQLFQRNIPLMVGDVSAANLRAFKIACRSLGFTVDCRRYGLRL